MIIWGEIGSYLSWVCVFGEEHVFLGACFRCLV